MKVAYRFGFEGREDLPYEEIFDDIRLTDAVEELTRMRSAGEAVEVIYYLD